VFRCIHQRTIRFGPAGEEIDNNWLHLFAFKVPPPVWACCRGLIR
jgi:hypothetical protein